MPEPAGPATLEDARAAMAAEGGLIPEPPAPKKTAPPRKRVRPSRAKKETAPKASAARSRKSLRKPLEELLGMVAGGVMLANPVDGQIIAAGAPRLAGELDALAGRNPAVHKWLSAMTEGGANLGLVLALSMIVVPILANHGLLPPEVAAMMGLASMLPEEAAPAPEPEAPAVNGQGPQGAP